MRPLLQIKTKCLSSAFVNRESLIVNGKVKTGSDQSDEHASIYDLPFTIYEKAIGHFTLRRLPAGRLTPLFDQSSSFTIHERTIEAAER